MNWDEAEGRWKQLSGRIRAEWGKLTDDEIATINGDRERFAGLIQEKYGVAREHADRQINDWLRRM